MPVVNAPFRVYWAYNPTRFEGTLAAPIVADKSYFPNTGHLQQRHQLHWSGTAV